VIAKDYTTDDKIYCYKGSNVLKNKLNLKSYEQLEKAEKFITEIRQQELESDKIIGNFDFEHLKLIHKKIFGDLYEFAGEIRRVNIEKGESSFCRYEFILEEGNKIFKKLNIENNYKGLEKEEFIIKLAELIGDLIALHPFREGNGRAIREFVRNLCENSNYDIKFQNIEPEKRLDAEIAAFRCNYSKLTEILRVELVKEEL
jgi:cell filamentation protein